MKRDRRRRRRDIFIEEGDFGTDFIIGLPGIMLGTAMVIALLVYSAIVGKGDIFSYAEYRNSHSSYESSDDAGGDHSDGKDKDILFEGGFGEGDFGEA